MTDTGITVSGGGSDAVDTPAMLQAAAVLAAAHDRLDVLRRRVQTLRSETAAGAPADGLLAVAQDGLQVASGLAGEVTAGLAVAARRYGVVEEVATTLFRDVAAIHAGALGTVVGAVRRGGGPDLDPAAVALIELEALAVVTVAAATRPLREPGRIFDPFADPLVVGAEGRGIASIDDLVRGEHGQETLADALGTSASAPYSTQRIAARGAALMHDEPQFLITDMGGTLQETPRGAGLAPPRDLAAVGALVPDDGNQHAQVRITEVAGADGTRRWIVAIAGTTTFFPWVTNQVFDMRSNLQGVGGVPMDSEATTEQAMRTAGIGPDDPVLVVGHSQGAIVAMRLAQSGHFDVQDVVTLGGPTRPIVPPASVQVLAVEHTDDPIPGTGGAAPDGPGPANRVLVRRTVYANETPRAWRHDTALAPAHLPSNYVDTLADVDRSGDPRLVAFRRQVQPFLTGSVADEQSYFANRGTTLVPPDPRRWLSSPIACRASDQAGRRVSAGRSGAPTGGAAAARPPSR